MLAIRLQRKGVIKKAFYRIVLTPKEVKGSAPALEILGFWQPSKDLLKIDKKKIIEWEKKGAKVSPAVTKLLQK